MKFIIIFAVLSAFLAVAGAIVVGVKTFDGPVAEHPYEEGLRWDHLNRNNEELGWRLQVNTADLRPGNNEMIFSVSSRSGSPLTEASLSVTISRPATFAYDAVYSGTPGRQGSFIVPVNFPFHGYWDMKVSVTRKGDSRIFEKRLFVAKRDGAP